LCGFHHPQAIMADKTYVEQAADLLMRTGYSLPLEHQPSAFLSSVWAALPTSTRSLVGLAHDDTYVDRATGKVMGATEPEWCFADEWHSHDFTPWIQAKNNDPALVQKGCGNIYWHGASRTRSVLGRYKARGRLDELVAVASLWSDYDAAELGMPLEPIYNALIEMELPPTWIIFSGGGLQAIHVLREPFYLGSKDAADEYKRTAKGLYLPLETNYGIRPDWQVSEAARMMRLAGTVNRKPKRGGAVARVVQYNPEATYMLADVQRFTLPPPAGKTSQWRGWTPDENNVYVVSRDFVKYVVDRVPLEQGRSRHKTLRSLAISAARGGMPAGVLHPRLEGIAADWFSRTNEPHRAEGELTKLIEWVYQNYSEDWSLGTETVKATPEGFERYYDAEAERALNNRIVDLEPQDIPAPPPTLELAELRKEQRAFIDAYLNTPTSRNYGTYLLVRSSPGAGKTYEALRANIRYVQRHWSPGDRGVALYLTQYRLDWNTGRAWLAEHGITDPELVKLFGFFVARDGVEASRGYCAQKEKADILGSKHHNIMTNLCHAGCPAFLSCQERGYLAQFKRLEGVPIVVARHPHASLSELADYRKLVTFDESPLDWVSDGIVVEMQHLAVKAVDPTTADHFPNELALVMDFLDKLRGVVASNRPASGKHMAMENVKLHGYWLMDNLARAMGEDRLERALAVDKKILERINDQRGDDLVSLASLPPNYLVPLIQLLNYEFHEHYAKGARKWNSRVVPYENTLRIYPMEPFSFTRDTRVMVFDGTGMPALHALAYTDKQGKPRKGIIFDRQLKKRATYYQFIGSENAKSTLLRGLSKLDEVPLQEPIENLDGEVVHTVSDPTLNGTLLTEQQLAKIGMAQFGSLLTMTHALARKYSGKLLCITYKAMIGSEDEDDSSLSFFRRWLQKTGAIAQENVQYFGNVRGKNRWAGMTAVFVIGTPRLQPVDFAILAQLWHYQDANPVDFTPEVHIVPYYYCDPQTGKGKGYRMTSYRDPRIHNLYLYLIQSELQQCLDRIRPNSSDGERHVYIGTAIPCTPYVDHFLSWENGKVQAMANAVLERHQHEVDVREEVLISDLTALAGCSEKTAREALRLEYAKGHNAQGVQWEAVYRLKYSSRRAEDAAGKTLKDRLVEWLRQNPDKAGSINETLKAARAVFPGVGRSTVDRALQTYKVAFKI
jgi:hypothetical protein